MPTIGNCNPLWSLGNVSIFDLLVLDPLSEQWVRASRRSASLEHAYARLRCVMELCVGLACGYTNAVCGGEAAVLLWSRVPSPIVYGIVSPGSKVSLSGVMILFWV